MVAALGGYVSADGLYRVYRFARQSAVTAIVEEAMPSVRGRIVCFGGDWLGRQFALDKSRQEGDENLVLMLEPGTGQALEIPATVRLFHDTELVEFADEALGVGFYESWRAVSGDWEPLDERSCVGYRTPLFLGGLDNVTNLERTDLDVYWHLMGELHRAVENVAPGTNINEVRIED